jgi:alanine racemase
MGVKMFLKNLFKFKYERLIKVFVYSSAISNNLHTFQARYKVAVAPVLKSNAYGHGLVEVGLIVDKEEVPFICVDSLFEAVGLRKAGVKKDILIIGYTTYSNIKNNRLKNIVFCVVSIEELRRLVSVRTRVRLHLKVDTGMHRYGILPEEISEALELVEENNSLVLEGVYSHLADAEVENSVLTESQIDTWNRVVSVIRQHTDKVKYFHCGQTAGSFYSNKLDANVIRLGIGLFGVASPLENISLQLALEVKSRVTSIKKLKEGEGIGYNHTFTAHKDMLVATIPVGYREGIDRRLSSRGSVIMNGVSCPILGRVSMNITSIDVSKIKNVSLDDEVVVISNSPESVNSVLSMAQICHTIPYEIMVHISDGLYREVI